MNDTRWKQYFENYTQAFDRLKMAQVAHVAEPDNVLIRMATIKAFEFTFELSWKTMKDYLKFKGIESKLPRDVITDALANNIIANSKRWIEMLEDRNLAYRAYNDNLANTMVEHIVKLYIAEFQQLHTYFKSKI